MIKINTLKNAAFFTRSPIKGKSLWLGHIMKGKLVFRIATYIFLSVIAFVYIYPFLYMAVTSIKSMKDLFDISVNWIPKSFYYQNYIKAFNVLKYPSHFLISVFLTGIGIFTHVIFGSFIAYGLARYKFPGRGLLFTIVILSILIPTQVLILPQYLQFARMKWTESYLPLIVPLFFGFGVRGGLFIFIFRQFFMTLPRSLEEAARIDGCGYLRVYWSIVLPTARTAMMVCIVMALVWHWNEYYEPLIYLNKVEYWPLPSMLPIIYNAYYSSFVGSVAGGTRAVDVRSVEMLITEGTVMAGTLLVFIPVLIAYGFLQKQFIQGIERSGLVE